jgi:hypothetical protein
LIIDKDTIYDINILELNKNFINSLTISDNLNIFIDIILKLKNLKKLELIGETNIKDDDLSQLVNLTSVYINEKTTNYFYKSYDYHPIIPIQQISDLGIKNLTNLTDLDNSFGHNITQNCLKNLINLKKINLGNMIINDDIISNLINLEEYSVPVDCPITNLGLNKLTNLSTLNFDSNIPTSFNNILTQIANLSLYSFVEAIKLSDDCVKKLINLKELNIYGKVDISDKYIHKLSKIEYLSIIENIAILMKINQLTNLTQLYLSDMDNIFDINFSKLINLKKLSLNNIKFIDINNFKNLNLRLDDIGNIDDCNLEKSINLSGLSIPKKINKNFELINLENLKILNVGPNLNLINKNIFNFDIFYVSFKGSKIDIKDKLIELDINIEKFRVREEIVKNDQISVMIEVR